MMVWGMNKMNNDYKKAQFKKIVDEAYLNNFPTIEGDAMVWADKRIIELETALRQAIIAMRAPLDSWKGEVERVALDMANEALK
jgi:hypothetical protein